MLIYDPPVGAAVAAGPPPGAGLGAPPKPPGLGPPGPPAGLLSSVRGRKPNRGGGVLIFRSSRDRFLTTLEWMAQLMQYASFAYNFGSAYPSKTLASDKSRTAAASTILRMTNFFIALSLGQHLEQLVQRMYRTCPRPFLLRPPDLRLTVMVKSNRGIYLKKNSLLDLLDVWQRLDLNRSKYLALRIQKTRTRH